MITPSHVHDHQEKLAEPGRYNVSRQFEIGDTSYMHAFDCNNPAWALRQLDDWQDCIVRRYNAKHGRRAAQQKVAA